jgi:hypothetical protein
MLICISIPQGNIESYGMSLCKENAHIFPCVSKENNFCQNCLKAERYFKLFLILK